MLNAEFSIAPYFSIQHSTFSIALFHRQLSLEALAGARTLVVLHRRVFEVGDAAARFVGELRDAADLVEDDLVDRVAGTVIVGMQPREVEDDRDPLRRVTVVVAPGIN